MSDNLSRLGVDSLATIYYILSQCPKLRFYLVRPRGALLLKLCAREFLHASSIYKAMLTGSKNVHTLGAHLRKSCTRP